MRGVAHHGSAPASKALPERASCSVRGQVGKRAHEPLSSGASGLAVAFGSLRGALPDVRCARDRRHGLRGRLGRIVTSVTVRGAAELCGALGGDDHIFRALAPVQVGEAVRERVYLDGRESFATCLPPD